MIYLTMEDSVKESDGIITINASGSLLEPGKPAIFEVIGPSAHTQRWFGVYWLGAPNDLN
jgi:hypothetical protein